MPALITLRLAPVSVPDTLPYLGEAVRSFVWDCLRDAAPDYAQRLQERNQAEPVALSVPLQPRRREPAHDAAAEPIPPPLAWRVRCGCLSEEFADALLAGVWQRYQSEHQVRLGPGTFRLAHPPFRLQAYLSYEALHRTRPETTWRMRFLSPTALTCDGVHHPLPVPHMVFGSLLLKWNALAPEPLRMAPDLTEAFSTGIEVAEFRGRTVRVELQSGEEVGFVGQTVFRILRDEPRLQQAVATLCGFAEFSGVGLNTTIGMGQVAVEAG